MPTDADYARLLDFRVQLRRFDQWSRAAAAEHGLTHAQHQLLLAIRGHRGEDSPTIGQVADHLLVKHHTVSELADRTSELGLVERVRDAADHRVVRLRLTEAGQQVITDLTAVHLDELRGLAPFLDRL
ncbi:MAG: MarR family winged helix-turn-helix transcriptional regulator [Oryzihumus sp.]